MSEIHKLLSASVRYGSGSGSGSHEISPDVMDFLAETVSAAVEDDEEMSPEETLTLLLDAGLGDIDADDLQVLAGTISLMTGCDSSMKDKDEEVDVADDDGTCELCEREVRRTFHHLIPKETHGKYLKKKTLPGNIKDIALDLGIDPCMNRVWLNTYGTMICSSCHSAVHNSASNEDLAEKYNTVELLLEHPKILAFAKYNSKQPVRSRCVKGSSKNKSKK